MVVKEREVNWIAYFSLNNIELDILLNTVFINYSEKRACTLRDYAARSVFERLNPNLVHKLASKGVIKSFQKNDESLFILTTRGIKAFFTVASPIYSIIDSSNGKGIGLKELSRKVSTRVLFGGVHRVYSVHEKLVEKIAILLHLMGFVYEENKHYKPKPLDHRVKALVNTIKRLSSIVFIRKTEDLVLSVIKAVNIPVERASEIISKLAVAGIVCEENEPVKALADLITGLETRAEASLREGRLLEAAAYEALAFMVADVITRLAEPGNGNSVPCADTIKDKLVYYTYERLGDYFYHSLRFDVAQVLYSKAASIAKEIPGLAREAQRTMAKYILSRARRLAQRKRYGEAISELQRLSEYYVSTGSLREADIARALVKELQADLEVLRGKACIAKDLYYEAADAYRMLGSDYENKSKAMLCKALISHGECKLLVEKNIDEAIKFFHEAIRVADEILSPHLKNAALSWYYEARARVDVNKGDILAAAKDFENAAKYYSARNLIQRSLLSMARAMKFYGFNSIFHKEIDEALEYMMEAEKYYRTLLRRIARKQRIHLKDFYMIGESVKGVCDTIALIRILEALKTISNSLIIGHATIDNVVGKMTEAAHYLLESAREEYADVMSVAKKIRIALETRNPKILYQESRGDPSFNNEMKEPRRGSIRMLLSMISSRVARMLVTQMDRIDYDEV